MSPKATADLGHAMARRLLSDEPTIELVVRARRGDDGAAEAILQRSLPRLKRWAHGRLPMTVRGSLDTADLVQETVLHVLRRLDTFDVRHVGAMQAYLRRSVINRIRDEVRKIARTPEAVELPDDVPSGADSPLDRVIGAETYQRYRAALMKLRPRDRELIITKVELHWSSDRIAEHFGFASLDTARRVVSRALCRLKSAL
jgi:RNA polymerase sigma-70 factor (ECF subfamily)